MFGKAIRSEYTPKMEREDEAIYYQQVKSFSDYTDLYKILTSEAFLGMLLTKTVA